MQKIVVEELGAQGHSVDHGLDALRCEVGEGGKIQFAVDHPGEEVQADGAHQGAANGSSTKPRPLAVATARAAATMVAVAPTLDAGSQLSPSLRAMVLL